MINLRSYMIAGALAAAGFLAQRNPDPVAQPAAFQLFQINGTVIDAASSAPLAHARVALEPLAAGGAQRTTVTGDDGRFAFNGLGQGAYRLSAERTGYLRQSFEQHDRYATLVVVGPDLEPGNLLFRLRRSAAIAGKITDDQNEPVRQAKVALFQVGIFGGRLIPYPHGSETTNDEGSYRFAHLPPGKYFLSVQAKLWYATSVADSAVGVKAGRGLLDAAYPITFYSGATDSAGASVISLGAGDVFTADIALHPVPALRLRVSLGQGESIEGAVIGLKQLVFGFPADVEYWLRRVDPGIYEETGIRPGHYMVQVKSTTGNLYLREIDLTSNSEISLTEATPSAVVSGLLQNETPAAVPTGTFIQLRNRKSQDVLIEQASAKGEFEFKESLPAGRYSVEVHGWPGFRLTGMVANGAKLDGQTFEINAAVSPAVKLTLLLAQGTGEVSGVVLRENKPVSGAMIELVPQDATRHPNLFQRNQSNTDGTFALDSVPPGTYTLLAIQNGWDLEWANAKALKPYMAKGEIIQVQHRGKHNLKIQVQ